MSREDFIKRLLGKDEDKRGNYIRIVNFDFNADKPYFQKVRISSK